MFCHACGAKNLPESRFCNQCGAPFATGPSVGGHGATASALTGSLDSTQLGVAGAAEIARAVAEADRLSAAATPSRPEGEPSRGSTPSIASAPLPAVAAPAASSFPLADEPKRGPVLSVTSSHSMRDASLRQAGFDPRILNDPSVSMHLASLGIVSKKKTWTILIGGAVAFLLLGGIISYFATRTDDTPQGTAHEGDPFTIGAPTADVDYVSGSNDPHAAMNPGRSDAGSTSTTGSASTGTTSTTGATHVHGTTGTTSTGTTGTSLPPLDPFPTTGTIATTGTTTTGTTGTTGTTESTGSTSTGTTGTTTTATTGTTDSTPEMDMEMYAARVRYLVRRYYAGRAQSCFNEATGRNPSLSGQVVLGIHISADGGVSGAHVNRNTTGDDALGACLASQANSWQVGPPPAGETDMSFPFSR